jgi:hypothetical protein
VKLFYSQGLLAQNKNSHILASLASCWSEKCTSKLVEVAEASKFPTVLFSSEGMSALPEDFITSLYSRLSINFDVTFVLFVRDPFDFVYSSWRQVVKARFHNYSFDHYVSTRLQTADQESRLWMFNISKTLIENNLKSVFINYDTHRKNLATEFLRASEIDLCPKNDKKQNKASIYNRSLSPSESLIQLVVNQAYKNSQFPAFFRTALLKRESFQPAVKHYYNKELDAKILQSYEKTIEGINNKLIGEKLRSSVKQEDSSSNMIEPQDVDVLINSIKFIESHSTKQTSFTKKLKHFIKAASLKNVPLDFDPQAYLEMNSDIAISGIDPYIHYSRNGCREGRPYRYY